MSVILPETAFISRFAIQVDDQVFVAFVKEKEDAWRLYQDAVTKGKTAGKSMEPSKIIVDLLKPDGNQSSSGCNLGLFCFVS